MLKLNPSLNTWDVGLYRNEAANEEGIPFYLAKEEPKKTRQVRRAPDKQGSGYDASSVAPSVFEEIAKIKNTKVAKKQSRPAPAEEEDFKLNEVITEKPDITIGQDLINQIRDGNEAQAERDHARNVASSTRSLQSDYFDFMEKRKGRQSELDADYEKIKGEPRPSGIAAMDLTNLYGLVDQMTGSNMTKNYKAPKVAEEHDAKLKAAQELALAHEGKLADDQFGFMKYDTENDQFMEGQDRDDARLDKQLKNALEIAKINAKARRDNPFISPSLGYRMQRDMTEDMRKLSQEIAPFATSVKTIENAEALLKQFPDAPGVGSIKERLKFFDSWTRDNGQFRNALAMVVQAYTKEISGAAFTDQERVRYQKALGDIATSNPRAIANGLAVLKELSYGKMEQSKSGYTREVQDMYERNGGFSQRNPEPKQLVNGTALQKSSSGAPPVGHVANGYRFKGGNHRDKSNWEKVK